MKKLIVLVAVLALVGAACTEPDSIREDREAAAETLDDLQKAHPVPKFQRSQLRQNLVELVTAQAETTQTTTFFFNMGIAAPVNQCPSIGFPIPATAQLTNPDQVLRSKDSVIPQVEPTGIYTGETTGTYVMCVDAEGSPYAVYWEGFVQTVTGPAEYGDGGVRLIGPPSFEFSADSE